MFESPVLIGGKRCDLLSKHIRFSLAETGDIFILLPGVRCWGNEMWVSEVIPPAGQLCLPLEGVVVPFPVQQQR